MKLNNKKWEVLSKKYLVKEPWCTLRVDHVRLPKGTEIPNYYIHEYPNWIMVIAITKQQEFLMIYQYRHGNKEYGYELVAGVCDATDASPLASAKRELLEETGYGNGKWEAWTEVSANPGTHSNLCYGFLATDVEQIDTQHLDETEELQVLKYSLEEVKQLLIDDRIKQSMHAAALWKYMAVNKLL